MATTNDYLTQLVNDKETLVNNLVEKGVEANANETFTSLVPKVLDIKSGGGEVTKGVVINKYDENGYAVDVTIRGFEVLTGNFFTRASTSGGWAEGAIIRVEEGLVETKTSVFAYCGTTKTIELPNSLEILGSSSFESCIKLENCTLPPNIKSMGISCFGNCYVLNLKEVPSGVTELTSSVFRECRAITEMTLKGDMTKLNAYAFYGCKVLKKISFPNNTKVPDLYSSNVFTNCPLEAIEVPSALVDSWKTKTNWSAYADIIVGI